MKSWAAAVAGRNRRGRKEAAAGPSVPRRPLVRQEIPELMMLMLDVFLRPVSPTPVTLLHFASHNSSSSSGHPIIISLRDVKAPMTSALYIELPYKDSGILPEFPDAKAVATHGNSILLHFAFDTSESSFEDFFVYQTSPLRLIKLPSCHHPSINLLGNKMGILCREEDFVVAHLTVTSKEAPWSGCPVEAELCYMLSSTCSWRTIECVPIHHAQSDLMWWDTDKVISFGDFICWFDYCRGMLFYDVSSPNLSLQYVPLPVHPYPYGGMYNPETAGRADLLLYRSVCATKDGIKFVDVAPWNVWFYGTLDFSRCPAAITSWTLSSDRSTWIEDGRMAMDELCSLTTDLNLPRIQLEFPFVDIKNSHIIYCIMRDRLSPQSQVFLVPIDLLNNTIGTPVPYTLEGLWCCGSESLSDTSCCNLEVCEPFLPFEFPIRHLQYLLHNAKAKLGKDLIRVRQPHVIFRTLTFVQIPCAYDDWLLCYLEVLGVMK